jgi:integrase
MFTNFGRMVDPDALRLDFQKWLKVAGLSGLTPHSMRHSVATWAIDRGEPVKWVSQQLGHSSIVITLNTYAKWFTLADQGAAARVGEGLFGNRLGNRHVA